MKKPVSMFSYTYKSIIGELSITANDTSVLRIDFGSYIPGELKETKLIREAYRQLEEYFQGKRKEFDLPLDLKGTQFQKEVWKALRDIPYGSTRSYKEIAIAVGSEKACRAVGMSNNKNPIPIVIPCHRVIGTNGKLVGYAGGLDVKIRLLELENSGSTKTWREI